MEYQVTFRNSWPPLCSYRLDLSLTPYGLSGILRIEIHINFNERVSKRSNGNEEALIVTFQPCSQSKVLVCICFCVLFMGPNKQDGEIVYVPTASRKKRHSNVIKEE